VLSHREQDPVPGAPLTYRECAYLVNGSPDRATAEGLLREKLAQIQTSIAAAAAGKLVNLALFTVRFSGRPPVPPIATLTWKDWRGDAVVAFPEPREAAKAPISTRPAAPLESTRPARNSTQPGVNPPLEAPATAAAPPPDAPAADAPAPKPISAPPPASARSAAAPPAAHPSAPPSADPPTVANPTIEAPPPSAASQAAAEVAIPATAPAPNLAPAPAVAADAEPPAPKPVSLPPAPEPEPAPAPTSAPPPTSSAAPPTTRGTSLQGAPASVRPTNVKGRARGDELIADLFEAMHDLHFLRDSVEGADFCLTLALEKMPARGGIVHLYDIDKREFVVTCVGGAGGEALLFQRTAESDPILFAAMRKRRALVFKDATTSEGVRSRSRYQALGGAKSLLVAPVALGGRFLGAIELLNPVDDAPFTDDDGHALSYIAEQLAAFAGTHGIVIEREPDPFPTKPAATAR
jgi:hypothetical protein